MEGVIKKMKFHVMAQVPPIQAMVHIAPYHMLIAYCDDMCLWLFGVGILCPPWLQAPPFSESEVEAAMPLSPCTLSLAEMAPYRY